MMLLLIIITNIWNNIAVILIPYIQYFVENHNISRSQDGKYMISFFDNYF